MSYAVRTAEHLRQTGGSSATERPTTAAVRSFICLYTHDLKRKQKRWQDGKLKFHTFNRRVMVYDERGGFVGDAHWQGEQDLEDGEELRLDRGSAIVQVCDYTGEQQQDLTEILDKRAQEVEKRRANAAARGGGSAPQPGMRTPAPSSRAANTPSTTTTPLPGRQELPRPHFQLLHRPLSAIMPSPGPIGRATVPEHSPYEARRAEQGQHRDGEEPATKRRRLSASPPSNSKSAFATRLFGAKLTLNGTAGALAARKKVLRDATNMQPRTEIEARSRADTEKGEIGEDEDDVVMLEGPPRSETRSQHLTLESSDMALTRPMSKAPVSRLREPQYPKSRAPVQARNHKNSASEDHDDHDDSHRPVPRPAVPSRSNGQREDYLEEDRVNSQPSLPPKPGRPIMPAQMRPKNKAGDNATDRVERSEAVDVMDEGISDVAAEEPARPSTCVGKETATKPRKPRKPTTTVREETPEPPTELRTELRIKSRRKRGLLMVSEKTVKIPSYRSHALETEEQPTAPAPPSRPSEEARTRAVSKPAPLEDISDIEEVPRSPPSQESRSRRDNRETLETRCALEDQIEDGTPVLETDSERLSDEETAAPVSRALEQKLGSESTKTSNDNRPQDNLRSLSDVDNKHDEDDDDIVLPRRRPCQVKKSTNMEEEDAAGEELDALDQPVHHSANVVQREKESEDEIESPKRQRLRRTRGQTAESELVGKTHPAHLEKRSKKAWTPFIDDDSSEEEMPQTRQLQRRAKAEKLIVDEEASSPDSEPATRPRRRTTGQPRSYKEDFPFLDDDDDIHETLSHEPAKMKRQREEPDETGPRIARMARKSVKSKEIFGFVLPNNNMVPTAMAAAFGRVGPVVQPEPIMASETPLEPVRKQEEQKRPNDAAKMSSETAGGAAPRIINPATRGKKAAKKEDAAGLAPQPLVPLEPVPVRRLAVPDKAAEKTSTLPGFSKASGGTWSKHAEDLLGMTRPGGQQ